MKTSTLTAALLDYWTGRAEGIEEQYLKLRRVQRSDELICVRTGLTATRYDPSTNPALGWPIIERDKIDIEHHPDDVDPSVRAVLMRQDNFLISIGRGETGLIAAMRAKVASVFGDEAPDIELPT